MTFWKRLACIGLAVLVILPFASCSSGKKANQLIKYNLSGEPVNLDPPLADDASSALVVTNLFEGLLRLAPDGKVTEGVAVDYEMGEDGLRYVFHLRENAVWSDKDKTPVTAQDFVFGFQRLFNPATGSVSAQKLYCIKNAEEVHSGGLSVASLGITANDSRTLTIELDYANPMFLTLLTTPAAMPCNEKLFTEAKGRYGLSAETLFSNGAYTLKEWSKGKHLALRRNADYHSATGVKNGGVSLYIQTDAEQTLKDFESGNIHAISTTGDRFSALGGKGNNIDQNVNSVWGLVFNRTKLSFANDNVVKALSLDMDRKSYRANLPDYLTPAYAVVPPAVTMLEKPYRGLAESVSAPGYQPEAALELMRTGYSQLGISSLSDVTIILPKDSPHADAFSYISQIWQRDLKVYFKVELLEPQEYQKRLASGNFDCTVMQLTGSYNSPEAFLKQFTEMEPYGIQIGGLQDLLNQAARSTLEQGTELYRQAERLVLDSGVFLPLYYQTNCFGTSSSVTGFIRDISGQIIDFKNCEFR